MGRVAFGRGGQLASRGAWLMACVGLGAAVLAVAAARADNDRPGTTGWETAADVAVGLGFVVAGGLAPGALASRVWFALVGVTWLIGSLAATAEVLHQAVLVVALISFPSGRPRGPIRWACVALAVPVAFDLVPQQWVSALFVAVAVVSVLSWRTGAVAASYPAWAGFAIAVALTYSWLSDQGAIDVDRATITTFYELAMASVAIGYVVTTHVLAARRAHLTDWVLGDERLAGLDGLVVVLRELLGDPDLAILRSPGPGAGDANDAGARKHLDRAERRSLPITDDEAVLGVIDYRASALADEQTASAVAEAVLLAACDQRLQEHLAVQLDELQAARTRLVEAADRQRALVAARLDVAVVSPLARTADELRAIDADAFHGEVAEAVGVVVQQLSAVADEVGALVGGAPPVPLGDGRLRAAVEALAVRSPIPVTMTAAGLTADDPDTETALYYVCSEALANAVKHAAATEIRISIGGDERRAELTVTDDGCGGADPLGSGLLGLADRLAACGGRLRVTSAPGAGTTVTATIPR